MKKIIALFVFITSISFAQTNTEVYLFNLKNTKGTFEIGTGKNISNNAGYDSQPHFYSNKSIVFSSTRNKQTDIARYDIETGKINFINNTPNGSEYSPQRIPKSKDISAVRLDKGGLQRFYKYHIKTGKSEELIPNLKVAYPMWYQKNLAISVVIVDKGLDLIISNLKTNLKTTIQKKVGRSLHSIPNSDLVSYISKTSKNWEVRSLNPKTGETEKIITLQEKKEDVCWLPNGTLLLANDNKLLKFNPSKDTNWSVFHTFPKDKFNNISRIIVNKKGTLLALVSD